MMPSLKPWINNPMCIILPLSTFLITIMAAKKCPSFGEEMRKEFALASKQGRDVAFCNHGSYGAVPHVVLNKRFDLLRECEAYPDLWYRKVASEKYGESLKRVAEFVHCSPKDIVFVPNPTTGINAVLRSFPFQPEEIILCTAHTYRAVLNIVDFTVTRWDADLLAIDIPLPIKSEDEIVELYVQACERNRSVKLAIVDHISSCSAIQFPVERIVKALHNCGVMVLIDGAHAPGQVDGLNIESIGADFYTGTLHKWAYATKGTGFLWVHPKHQDWIHPVVTSHNYKLGFQEEFFKQGTGDWTPYLCMETALDFYDWVGGKSAIGEYCQQLLDFAEKLLIDAFHVDPLDIPHSMRAPNMRVVGFPETPVLPDRTFDAIEKLLPVLVDKHDLVVALCYFNGRVWMRFSANIYNTKQDYVDLRDRLSIALQIGISK